MKIRFKNPPDLAKPFGQYSVNVKDDSGISYIVSLVNVGEGDVLDPANEGKVCLQITPCTPPTYLNAEGFGSWKEAVRGITREEGFIVADADKALSVAKMCVQGGFAEVVGA